MANFNQRLLSLEPIIGTAGTGVLGNSSTGVRGISNGQFPNAGVVGTSSLSSAGTGVFGSASGSLGTGVYGEATGFAGVQGNATGGNGMGVSGVAGGSGGHAIDGNCNGACAGSGFAGFFSGNVNVTGVVSMGSDARLKKDIRDLPYGLDHVMRMRPVSFRWKQAGDDRVQIGLIAQEVRTVVPEVVVATDSSGMLSVNYVALLPVMIKAIQEQERVIQRQEDRIEALERALSSSASETPHSRSALSRR